MERIDAEPDWTTDGYELYASSVQVKKEWDAIVADRPADAKRCYERLSAAPQERYAGRQFPLRGGNNKPFWEYELNGSDRVIYGVTGRVVVISAGPHVKEDVGGALSKLIERRRGEFDDYDSGRSTPVILADGSFVPRIPGFRRWMWDGDFAGTIGFRWVPGTPALPPHCSGHIGYSVVPWKRRRGYATAALALMLPEARQRGLPYVELVTDIDNLPSQRVILANGGALVGDFQLGPEHGSAAARRFRIPLQRD